MPSDVRSRIFLSPPHMSGRERDYVQQAFDSNWVAPLGPNVDAFEREFADFVGARYAVALSSGTAALHLALLVAGVGPGDEIMVSTFTFAASVNPILYTGATPVFVDSERESWNMDPELLEQGLRVRADRGKLPKAIIAVHLYGQSANLAPLQSICAQYEIPLIEDAAEALGATYQGRSPGTFGLLGAFSFNGNKIITTSGGGMLVSQNEELVAHARKLSTQSRDAAPHYQHSEIGFNYRMSNVSAGIGRGQLEVLKDRVEARRRNFHYYFGALHELPGLEFMPEAPWGSHSRWLTTITIDPKLFGNDREFVRLALEKENIESRPVWKPMHLQPVFAQYPCIGGSVAEDIFEHGLCLPSGSNLGQSDLELVISVIERCAGA